MEFRYSGAVGEQQGDARWMFILSYISLCIFILVAMVSREVSLQWNV